MKAYLFSSETGLYVGETFEEPDILPYEDGLTAIPPPDYELGQVPMFDRQKKEWAVIPVTTARQLLSISKTKTTEKTT